MPDATLAAPLFRHDLDVTQTEQDGVRTFVVRDDVTGESFRMYAVEYALAQQLDGTRDLAGIVAHAQATLGVNLTQDDLIVFLRQLAERGLVRHFVDPAYRAPSAPEDEKTHTTTLHGEAVVQPDVDPVLSAAPPPAHAPELAPLEGEPTLASPADAVAAGAYALITQELDLAGMPPPPPAAVRVDPQELDHLLRDAIHRMVQDDVRGAATILHAAQALAPQDARLQQLVAATGEARQSGTPAARAALRQRGATLYPELMPKPMTTSSQADTRPDNAKAYRRGRGKWAVIALILIGVAGAAGVWRYRAQAPTWVSVRQVPLIPHQYVSQPATDVAPQEADTLHFAEAGVLAQVLKPGTRVQPQQVVARQRLPDPVRRRLEAAMAKSRAADAALASLQAARERLSGERRALQRQGAASRRGASPRTAAKLMARQRWVERRERQVRAALVGAQSRRTQASLVVKAQEEAASGHLLRASCACVVGPGAAAVGTTLAAGAPVLTLMDTKRLKVQFLAPPGATLAVGTPVAVRVDGHEPPTVPGTVVQVGGEGGPGATDTAIGVAVAEAGPLAGLPAQAYRLVLADAAQAAHVPRTSLIPPGRGQAGSEGAVWAMEAGRLHRREVSVMDGDSAWVWVAPRRLPWAHESLPLVLAASGQALGALKEGGLAAPLPDAQKEKTATSAAPRRE